MVRAVGKWFLCKRNEWVSENSLAQVSRKPQTWRLREPTRRSEFSHCFCKNFSLCVECSLEWLRFGWEQAPLCNITSLWGRNIPKKPHWRCSSGVLPSPMGYSTSGISLCQLDKPLNDLSHVIGCRMLSWSLGKLCWNLILATKLRRGVVVERWLLSHSRFAVSGHRRRFRRTCWGMIWHQNWESYLIAIATWMHLPGDKHKHKSAQCVMWMKTCSVF